MVTTSCCPIAFHVLVTVPSDTGVYTPGDAMLSNATGSAIGDAATCLDATTTTVTTTTYTQPRPQQLTTPHNARYHRASAK